MRRKMSCEEVTATDGLHQRIISSHHAAAPNNHLEFLPFWCTKYIVVIEKIFLRIQLYYLCISTFVH